MAATALHSVVRDVLKEDRIAHSVFEEIRTCVGNEWTKKLLITREATRYISAPYVCMSVCLSVRR